MDANPLKLNANYLAFPWFVAGTIAVVPTSFRGALSADLSLIQYEESKINDFNFHPFDDRVIVAGHDNNAVTLWKFPEGGPTQDITSPFRQLDGHDKRVLCCEFHPLASEVLVTADAGKSVKFWDVEKGSAVLSLPDEHKALLTNWSFNRDGSLIATHCKDKFLRVFDPRSRSLVGAVSDHDGNKGSRVVWLHQPQDRIFTVGTSKNQERCFAVYDPKNMSKPLSREVIDIAPSTLMPFYEQDGIGVMYLAGKGDANIRYYEYENDKLFLLSEYKSKEPQTGIAPFPKISCDIKKCEITRFLKLTPQGAIIPIRMEVPRKDNHFFQDDIFPDTFAGQPSMSAAEWFGGVNRNGKTMSLNWEKK